MILRLFLAAFLLFYLGACADDSEETAAEETAAEETAAVDKCATDNGGCGDSTYYTCTNNEGANPTCADIDECATDNGGCGEAADYTCTNNEGAAPTCGDVDAGGNAFGGGGEHEDCCSGGETAHACLGTDCALMTVEDGFCNPDCGCGDYPCCPAMYVSPSCDEEQGMDHLSEEEFSICCPDSEYYGDD